MTDVAAALLAELDGSVLMEYAEMWGVINDSGRGRPGECAAAFKSPGPNGATPSTVMPAAMQQQPAALGGGGGAAATPGAGMPHQHHAELLAARRTHCAGPQAATFGTPAPLRHPAGGLLGPGASGGGSMDTDGPGPSAHQQRTQPHRQSAMSCSASVELDVQTMHANQAAELAVGAAAGAIDAARRVLADVTSSQRQNMTLVPRNASVNGGGGGGDGAGAPGQNGGGGGGSSGGGSGARRKSMRAAAAAAAAAQHGGDASTSYASAAATAAAAAAPSASASAAATSAAGLQGPGGKGLRQFAVLVCEQVRERGRTTYNDVADVLVAKLTGECQQEGKDLPDDKTIRRRVYDALNVLMAIGIIQREKKDILWCGLPQLAELIEQHGAMKQLIARNAAQPLSPGSGANRIYLPFILLQARPDATVEVQISPDLQNVSFDIYDSPIELHDDSGVLKHMAAAAREAAAAAAAAVAVGGAGMQGPGGPAFPLAGCAVGGGGGGGHQGSGTLMSVSAGARSCLGNAGLVLAGTPGGATPGLAHSC